MNDKIAIYGAGGFAREVAWLLESPKDHPGYEHVAYIDDADQAEPLLSAKPVMGFTSLLEKHPDAQLSIAVGDPLTREKIAQKCTSENRKFATLVHSSVQKSGSVVVGEGCVICCGTILTVDITLGEHVHINLDCTIGHDVIIGDYVTLSPGVHISGNVIIGKGAYIGTGVSVINGSSTEPLILGERCVIGAGACVTKSTEAHSLYTGVPAQLKKTYGPPE